MVRLQLWTGWKAIVLFLAVFIVGGCAPTKVSTGAFTQVNGIETSLKRGASTKMDVQRLLGTPKGFGGTLLAGYPGSRDVWFYGDIEATDFKSSGQGFLQVKVRQQFLLIFFDKEVFDGFLWFSNAGTAEEIQ